MKGGISRAASPCGCKQKPALDSKPAVINNGSTLVLHIKLSPILSSASPAIDAIDYTAFPFLKLRNIQL